MIQSPEALKEETAVKSQKQKAFSSKWSGVTTTGALEMKNLLPIVNQGVVFTVKERITGVTSVKLIQLLSQERQNSKETALFV